MPDLAAIAAFARRVGASLQRNGDGAQSDEDWQAAYDERAAILEYVEGLSRHEAESLARDQVFCGRPIGHVKLRTTRDAAQQFKKN